MKSDFQQWLEDFQYEADKDIITVKAIHYDILDYYFKMKLSPLEAYNKYKTDFLPRFNAINKINDNEILIQLVEFTSDINPFTIASKTMWQKNNSNTYFTTKSLVNRFLKKQKSLKNLQINDR